MSVSWRIWRTCCECKTQRGTSAVNLIHIPDIALLRVGVRGSPLCLTIIQQGERFEDFDVPSISTRIRPHLAQFGRPSAESSCACRSQKNRPGVSDQFPLVP